jgi:teichuronic acid biosynthesis glycosyltransferase TuaC
VNVLVISHMYPKNYNPAYGIFVHQQLQALKQEGIHTCVLSPTPWAGFPLTLFLPRWHRYRAVPRAAEVEGITVRYPRYLAFPGGYLFDSSGRRAYRAAAGIFRELLEAQAAESPFDLIHAHTALPDGQAALLASRCFKLPYVLTIHGQDFQQVIHRSPANRRAVEEVLEGAARVFLVSEKLLRLGEKHFPQLSEKFQVISNGINSALILKAPSPLAEAYKGRKIITSVSNLKKTKGITYNLRALKPLVKKHPELLYLIIGDGPERASLEAQVKNLGLKEHVRFLGALENKQVMEYLSFTAIFSLPSYNEGFGVVYLEAAAHGCPLIACRGEGIDGVFRDGESALFVERRDTKSVREALCYLLDNPAKARALGEKARKLVLTHYTWEANARATKEAYDAVLNRE